MSPWFLTREKSLGLGVGGGGWEHQTSLCLCFLAWKIQRIPTCPPHYFTGVLEGDTKLLQSQKQHLALTIYQTLFSMFMLKSSEQFHVRGTMSPILQIRKLSIRGLTWWLYGICVTAVQGSHASLGLGAGGGGGDSPFPDQAAESGSPPECWEASLQTPTVLGQGPHPADG